jgi:hypothetical protein
MGPVRADVDPAMVKWWAKKRPAEGQVRKSYMTISARILRSALLLKLSVGGAMEIGFCILNFIFHASTQPNLNPSPFFHR